MAFLFFAGMVVWNLCWPDRDTRLETIRKKGFPTTLSELNRWYQDVTDSQNNARIYERAFALPGFGNFDVDWPAGGQALSAKSKKEWAELMASNRPALALLHSAQSSNRCRYPIDFNKIFSRTGGHDFAVLTGVKLLCAEALLLAGNGECGRAIGSFRSAGLLANSEAEEPWLIAQIVRIASWSIIVQRVENAMTQTQLTEDQLASLQAMIAGAEQPEALLRGLAGDRAIGIAVFSDPVIALADGGPRFNSTECLKEDLVVGLSKTAGIFEKDRASYLEAMEKAVEAASLPFPERLNLGQKTPSGWIPPRFCSISNRVLPRISSIFASEAETVARLRSAQVALAVERFRCRHRGVMPASLEELIPDFLPALPLDPFDGKRLRLEVIGSNYGIYTSMADSRKGGALGFRVLRQQDTSSP